MQGRIFIIATAYDAHCAAEDTGMGVEAEHKSGLDWLPDYGHEAQIEWMRFDEARADALTDANERDWLALA